MTGWYLMPRHVDSDLACTGTFYVTRMLILLLSPNPEAQISKTGHMQLSIPTS